MDNAFSSVQIGSTLTRDSAKRAVQHCATLAQRKKQSAYPAETTSSYTRTRATLRVLQEQLKVETNAQNVINTVRHAA